MKPLLKKIEEQEKKWRRAKRFERRHKEKLFDLLKMQMEARKR